MKTVKLGRGDELLIELAPEVQVVKDKRTRRQQTVPVVRSMGITIYADYGDEEFVIEREIVNEGGDYETVEVASIPFKPPEVKVKRLSAVDAAVKVRLKKPRR